MAPHRGRRRRGGGLAVRRTNAGNGRVGRLQASRARPIYPAFPNGSGCPLFFPSSPCRRYERRSCRFVTYCIGLLADGYQTLLRRFLLGHSQRFAVARETCGDVRADKPGGALASIHRPGISCVVIGAWCLRAVQGVVILPLTGSAACPGSWLGGWGAEGGRWAVAGADLVGAGQAAAAGGPQAASQRLSHSCSRCQPCGRWRVRWPLPWRAVRAAMAIRSRRMVAPRALA